MDYAMENPKIEWTYVDKTGCLKFTFKGNFNKEDAKVAVEEWKRLFAFIKDELVIIIRDCSEMKAYDSMARTIWQKAIKEFKKQIDSIWLITESRMIKAGGMILYTFTSCNIKVVRSQDQIIFNK